MAPAAPRQPRRTAPAARTAWHRYPARVLHLIDIENLAGTGAPAEWQVARLCRAYAARVGIGSLDQVVIGCSHMAERRLARVAGRPLPGPLWTGRR